MVTCEDFDGFVPFQQSEPYAVAARAMGARAAWRDLACGRALVLERGRLRSVFRGPVWAAGVMPAERRRDLRRLARWLGATVATPEDPVTGLGLVPLLTPLHHAIWDLRSDLRAGLAGNWRASLMRSERAGLRVRRGGRATLEALMSAEATQRRARGYRALPSGFSRALPEADLRLWEWRQAGAMQAAMCFVVHGSSATYHLAWGAEAARSAGVHGLMLFRAAEALAAEGVRWLDLGSVDTEAAPGLARFKLGTGARLKRLGPTLLVLP